MTVAPTSVRPGREQHRSRTVLIAGLAFLLGGLEPATISTDEVKEGMKGYGLTVFKGTEPERFDVEVIGVLQTSAPGSRSSSSRRPTRASTSSRRCAGMSGSPIFLDGRARGRLLVQPRAVRGRAGRGRDAHRSDAHRDAAPHPAGLLAARAGGAASRGARLPAPPAHAAARSLTASTGAPGTYDLRSTPGSSPSAWGRRPARQRSDPAAHARS